MDVQTIIVGIIILIAAVYIGKISFGKIKSFSPKSSSCASDCGCETKVKN